MNENAYIPEPFLKKTWERSGARERGDDDKEAKGASFWSEIELASAKKPCFKKIFEQVKKDIARYQSAIRAFKEARQDRETKEAIDEIELKYKNENRAHQRLVADLNLLARQFKEHGISNKWREEIGLTDEEVGRWAENLQIF